MKPPTYTKDVESVGSMDKTEAEKIQILRSKIPRFECIPGCHDCCGPHPWTRWEWEQVPIKKKATSLICPYVTPKGCEVYEHRPMICRLYGASEDLPCPHACGPKQPLSHGQTQEIMRKYLKPFEEE